jgi:antitoxin component YwqK of YwqJK toxin-antitoxin module
MKYPILIFLCLVCIEAFGQKLPDYGLNKVRITQTDKIIVAEIEPVSSNPSIKRDLIYYWYSANIIHATQGGFSGTLLNGRYTEYYPDKNLKEQGEFKNGLKDGVWKNWSDDGTLMASTNWKHGSEVTVKRPPIWKRVHLFGKKAKTADSLNNIKK